MVMVSAAAPRIRSLRLFGANRIKGALFEFDVKAGHFQHVWQIADRGREESILGDCDAGASVHERDRGLLQQIRVSRDVEHGLNGRADHPEGSRLIDEHVVHFQGAHFLNGKFHRAVFGFERLRHRSTLIRVEHELLGVLQNGLSRRGIRGQELGELDHGSKS